jgi:hypothetical protein
VEGGKEAKNGLLPGTYTRRTRRIRGRNLKSGERLTHDRTKARERTSPARRLISWELKSVVPRVV